MFRRMYHTSYVTYNLKKQGLKLNKMLNPKSKKQWYPAQSLEAAAMPSIKSLTKVKHEPGKQGVQRLAMLNKLFMKNITDLMSTGTVAMEIVGRGIEVSKVQVTPDLQTVNVFWVCKGNSSDEETDEILRRTAGALRHELSTLRVMGEVPYISFVKDKHEAQLVDLDRRLATADYGEDYTPTDAGHILKTEFSLDTKLSPEMKAKIKQLEEENEIVEDLIPEMTHNVYGLDHEKIMNRLMAARKRSKDAWIGLAEDSPVISYRSPLEKVPDVDTANQKQELADFLQKRQILQNKLHKQLREEWQLTLHENNQDNEEEVYDDDDEDYYDEEAFDDEYNSNHRQVGVLDEKLDSKR